MPECPECRHRHPEECGRKLYIEAKCPLCLDDKSPFFALPCGHGLCEVCFRRWGGTMRRATPSPRRRSRRRSRSRSRSRRRRRSDSRRRSRTPYLRVRISRVRHSSRSDSRASSRRRWERHRRHVHRRWHDYYDDSDDAAASSRSRSRSRSRSYTVRTRSPTSPRTPNYTQGGAHDGASHYSDRWGDWWTYSYNETYTHQSSGSAERDRPHSPETPDINDDEHAYSEDEHSQYDGDWSGWDEDEWSGWEEDIHFDDASSYHGYDTGDDVDAYNDDDCECRSGGDAGHDDDDYDSRREAESDDDDM